MENKKMRIVYICPNASNDISELSEKYAELTTHEGDAGLDLFCLKEERLGDQSQDVPKVDLGFSMVIVDQVTALGIETEVPIAFMLLSRSSTHKKGILQANSVGIVDAGYRGNLMVPCIAMYVDTVVNRWERLFQVVPFDGMGVDSIEYISSQEKLEERFPSSRSTGGFGSTGV